MAEYLTYADIKAKVERDLDLEDEIFITDDEMLGYANEAIDEVEKDIHTLCEDYFLTRATITLVQGQEEYDLPTDIYAMKIREIIYKNGSECWSLVRCRDWHKFKNYTANLVNNSGTQKYGYFILNSTAGTPKLLLTPSPNEAGAYLTMWYIRNANKLTTTTSICDIPEAINYVMQYMKVKCAQKELHPNLAGMLNDLEAMKQKVLAALSEMYPDTQNDIEPDTSHYEEMS